MTKGTMCLRPYRSPGSHQPRGHPWAQKTGVYDQHRHCLGLAPHELDDFLKHNGVPVCMHRHCR